MPHTDGRWTGGTSFPGGQFFVGADEFVLLGGTAPLPATIATPGLLFRTVAAGSAAIFAKTLSELLLRQLILATAAYDQNQFGTAAAQPGPSSVAGTSGPLAMPTTGTPNYQAFPPFPNSKLPTVSGNTVSGATGKGIQIDSVDVIYQVLTDATAVAATIGLTQTVFANLVAPVVTNLITLGANGLPVVIGAQPQLKNVAVTTPAMITTADSQVLLNINLTGGTGGTIKFYGANINFHFNFA